MQVEYLIKSKLNRATRDYLLLSHSKGALTQEDFEEILSALHAPYDSDPARLQARIRKGGQHAPTDLDPQTGEYAQGRGRELEQARNSVPHDHWLTGGGVLTSRGPYIAVSRFIWSPYRDASHRSAMVQFVMAVPYQDAARHGVLLHQLAGLLPVPGSVGPWGSWGGWPANGPVLPLLPHNGRPLEWQPDPAETQRAWDHIAAMLDPAQPPVQPGGTGYTGGAPTKPAQAVPQNGASRPGPELAADFRLAATLASGMLGGSYMVANARDMPHAHRLWWLDAALALLPYWVRAFTTVGTEAAVGDEHALHVVFDRNYRDPAAPGPGQCLLWDMAAGGAPLPDWVDPATAAPAYHQALTSMATLYPVNTLINHLRTQLAQSRHALEALGAAPPPSPHAQPGIPPTVPYGYYDYGAHNAQPRSDYPQQAAQGGGDGPAQPGRPNPSQPPGRARLADGPYAWNDHSNGSYPCPYPYPAQPSVQPYGLPTAPSQRGAAPRPAYPAALVADPVSGAQTASGVSQPMPAQDEQWDTGGVLAAAELYTDISPGAIALETLLELDPLARVYTLLSQLGVTSYAGGRARVPVPAELVGIWGPEWGAQGGYGGPVPHSAGPPPAGRHAGGAGGSSPYRPLSPPSKEQVMAALLWQPSAIRGPWVQEYHQAMRSVLALDLVAQPGLRREDAPHLVPFWVKDGRVETAGLEALYNAVRNWWQARGNTYGKPWVWFDERTMCLLDIAFYARRLYHALAQLMRRAVRSPAYSPQAHNRPKDGQQHPVPAHAQSHSSSSADAAATGGVQVHSPHRGPDPTLDLQAALACAVMCSQWIEQEAGKRGLNRILSRVASSPPALLDSVHFLACAHAQTDSLSRLLQVAASTSKLIARKQGAAEPENGTAAPTPTSAAYAADHVLTGHTWDAPRPASGPTQDGSGHDPALGPIYPVLDALYALYAPVHNHEAAHAHAMSHGLSLLGGTDDAPGAGASSNEPLHRLIARTLQGTNLPYSTVPAMGQPEDGRRNSTPAGSPSALHRGAAGIPPLQETPRTVRPEHIALLAPYGMQRALAALRWAVEHTDADVSGPYARQRLSDIAWAVAHRYAASYPSSPRPWESVLDAIRAKSRHIAQTAQAAPRGHASPAEADSGLLVDGQAALDVLAVLCNQPPSYLPQRLELGGREAALYSASLDALVAVNQSSPGRVVLAERMLPALETLVYARVPDPATNSMSLIRPPQVAHPASDSAPAPLPWVDAVLRVGAVLDASLPAGGSPMAVGASQRLRALALRLVEAALRWGGQFIPSLDVLNLWLHRLEQTGYGPRLYSAQALRVLADMQSRSTTHAGNVVGALCAYSLLSSPMPDLAAPQSMGFTSIPNPQDQDLDEWVHLGDHLRDLLLSLTAIVDTMARNGYFKTGDDVLAFHLAVYESVHSLLDIHTAVEIEGLLFRLLSRPVGTAHPSEPSAEHTAPSEVGLRSISPASLNTMQGLSNGARDYYTRILLESSARHLLRAAILFAQLPQAPDQENARIVERAIRVLEQASIASPPAAASYQQVVQRGSRSTAHTRFSQTTTPTHQQADAPRVASAPAGSASMDTDPRLDIARSTLLDAMDLAGCDDDRPPTGDASAEEETS
jgi:hypothetical protein